MHPRSRLERTQRVTAARRAFLPGSSPRTTVRSTTRARDRGRITGLKDLRSSAAVAGRTFLRHPRIPASTAMSAAIPPRAASRASWNYGTIGDSRSTSSVISVYVRPTGEQGVGGLAGLVGYIQNGFMTEDHRLAQQQSRYSTGIQRRWTGRRLRRLEVVCVGQKSRSPADFITSGGLVGLNLSLRDQESFATAPSRQATMRSSADWSATTATVPSRTCRAASRSLHEGGFVGANGRGSRNRSRPIPSARSRAAPRMSAASIGLETLHRIGIWTRAASRIRARGAGNMPQRSRHLTGLSDTALKAGAAVRASIAHVCGGRDPSINNGYPYPARQSAAAVITASS